jgi:hypothetical protein
MSLASSTQRFANHADKESPVFHFESSESFSIFRVYIFTEAIDWTVNRVPLKIARQIMMGFHHRVGKQIRFAPTLTRAFLPSNAVNRR